MSSSRVLFFALLPFFAGCQSFPWSGDAPQRPTERLQGEVTRVDGRLMFRSCQGQRSLELLDAGATELPDDADALLGDNGDPLFADVRGSLSSGPDGTGQLQLTKVYRLQAEGPGCGESGFRELILHASGHEPGWNVRVSGQGMLLERLGQPPLAVPYLEEQLPSGHTSFSSEANSQRLNLWVAPQRCVDIATGTVSHLTAELRLDHQTLRGCAYYGGARND